MQLDIKKIMDLKGEKFYVPAYQRGYRWTWQEVKALMDDIYEFDVSKGQSYCIQPLIVQKNVDKGVYDVVDGQQRLTTLFIFMKVAQQEIRSASPMFELEYETRKESAAFLQNLSDDMDFENEKEKNIDFYHIVNAYKTITDWLDEKEDKSVAIQEMNTKIRKNVFFIWYEIPENVDAIERFRKVNMGKIPLTNADLIKALIMSRDNYDRKVLVNKHLISDDDLSYNTYVEKRQIEIATLWDRIEQGLHNDSLWYFLNENGNYKTRIDIIFRLIAKNRLKTMDYNINEDERYYSFLVISEQMKKKDAQEIFEYINEFWAETERIYSMFNEWYNDDRKYHLIGYLICSGVELSTIMTIADKNDKKSRIFEELLNKTKECSGLKDKDDIDGIEKLTLEMASSNQKNKIRKVLLLFNIAYIVCNSESQYRFPFELYKPTDSNRVMWDIEHIHATADETADADDNIGNLALLDSSTNREYKNKEFNEKRKEILEKSKKGRFIPLCTKNVFLKVYTENPKNMDLWDNDDKKAYVKEMKSTFTNFFKGEWMKDGEKNTGDIN